MTISNWLITLTDTILESIPMASRKINKLIKVDNEYVP